MQELLNLYAECYDKWINYPPCGITVLKDIIVEGVTSQKEIVQSVWQLSRDMEQSELIPVTK